MSPKAKRPKLDGLKLLGTRRLTNTLVRAVIQSLPKNFDVNNADLYTNKAIRNDISDAMEDYIDADIATTINLPLVDGETFTWHLARPQGLLRKLVKASDSLKRSMRSVPNSVDAPWSIVHYHDEVTSGNLLAPVHGRAFVAFRFTFKEFGKFLVTCQQMWFTFAVLRTSVLERVVGETSYVVRMVMHLCFTSTDFF